VLDFIFLIVVGEKSKIWEISYCLYPCKYKANQSRSRGSNCCEISLINKSISLIEIDGESSERVSILHILSVVSFCLNKSIR